MKPLTAEFFLNEFKNGKRGSEGQELKKWSRIKLKFFNYKRLRSRALTLPPVTITLEALLSPYLPQECFENI